MEKQALFNRLKQRGIFTTTRESMTTGNVFFVCSTGTYASDAAGYGESPDSPFATVDYAVGQCTANNGDIIYVMPTHAEDLDADGAVDVDIAGISIIGLGYGVDRPTFTASAIAGDFKLAAADTYIENLIFLSGIDATTGMVEVSAANCTIKDCEFRDDTDEATDCLITTAAADGLLVDGCKFLMDPGAGANSAIALVGADDTEIKNCYIYGNFATGGIDLRTTLSARINIHDCTIWTEHANDLCIDMNIAACTGFVGPNVYLVLQDDAANITEAVTSDTLQIVDPVYVVNAVNEKGCLIDWTASTNA